jgi:DNA modification methylase
MLLQGDCLELMSSIDDKSIDLILCDLPYGTTCNKWDTVIPFDKLWAQYNRIIKDNGAIVLFSQMPFGANLIMSNPKMFRYEWIWEKERGTGFLNAKKMPLKVHENILVFYKHLPTYNPQMRTGFKPYTTTNRTNCSSNYGDFQEVVIKSDGDRYPIDIVEVNREMGLHPTQKPVALLEYLIKTYTNEGDLVLDNCMGSGSTGVACVNINRDFIGIELDENYFNVAKKRIEVA